jgi:hypothetical protein
MCNAFAGSGVSVFSCDEDDFDENLVVLTEKSTFAKLCTKLTGVDRSSSGPSSPSTTSSPDEAMGLGLPRVVFDHNDWLSPVLTIAKHYPRSVIVCHRETIRNITEVRN